MISRRVRAQNNKCSSTQQSVERLATRLLNKCVSPVGRHEVAWAGNPSWWQALTTEMNTKYEIIILIRSLSTSITICCYCSSEVIILVY